MLEFLGDRGHCLLKFCRLRKASLNYVLALWQSMGKVLDNVSNATSKSVCVSVTLSLLGSGRASDQKL